MTIDISSLRPADANERRARWALKALESFGQETGQAHYLDGSLEISEDIIFEVAGDLITALFHLAGINGVTPEDLVSSGRRYFEEDRRKAEAAKGLNV